MSTDILAQGLAAEAHDELFPGGRSRFGRLDTWARQFNGLGRPFQVMSSPPTLTYDRVNLGSNINTSLNNGNYEYYASNPSITYAGLTALVKTGSDPLAYNEPKDITLSTNAKTPQTLWRMRFSTYAPKVDFVMHDVGGGYTLLVDGELTTKLPIYGGQAGQARHLYCDWGADTVTYRLTSNFTISSGGTGHAVGDILTLDGGGATVNSAPKVVVTAVSAGVVTAVKLTDPGSLASAPSVSPGAISQTATTGSGTGFTCVSGQQHNAHSTIKLRKYELLINSCRLRGVILNPNAAAALYALLPYRLPAGQPKVVFVGDSICAGTYALYWGNTPASIAAKMLGLWDRHVVLAQGGTGWNTDNGTALRWSDARRIADVVAFAPDLVVYVGSQNDVAGAPLTAAVTVTLNTLLAALPNVRIVGAGNIALGVQATADAIAAGFAAARDQSRVRFINNQNPKWMPSETAWTIQNDTAHLNEEGCEMWGAQLAEGIAWAVCDMCL
ncbi:SGNH/GDSL hydrolase family protein [Xanthobacter aminoxidans]|uniref:SGNH/GDSL hydrolase family protein n=1 Tax=Xanthobacter aminoxidans TaxID=186280 RepID=UPI003726EE79